MSTVVLEAAATRFTIEHGNRIEQVVLVGALGLGPFRPSLRFVLTMVGFIMRPNERTYSRLMQRCSFDLDDLSEQMGAR